MQSSVLGTALPEPSCWKRLNLVSSSLLWERSLISIVINYFQVSFLSYVAILWQPSDPFISSFGTTSFRHCLWCGISEGLMGFFRPWVVFLTAFNTQNSFTGWVFVKVFDLFPLYPYFWNLLFLLILYFTYWIWDPGGMLILWLQYEILTHITSE